MKTNILIIDYGIGNFQAVANALNFLGYDFSISNNPKEVKSADALILPGVGAFHETMGNLEKRGFVDPLCEEVLEKKKPILGICIGMQVLATTSKEFGLCKGLGWVKGEVVRLQNEKRFPLPHVGWNNLTIIKKEPLFSRVKENPNYYFDHSFHFMCDQEYVTATANYGVEFIASIQKENIFGTQFHPEKSQENGLKLLRSLIESMKNHVT
ncbi:MAG: imidazole glycerol phosphate synthase subunit HisH [Candidatus Harrisonbacteria bacterium CG10_big_fil_rev_8_21_14_0_10_42_17]|uniref:Imidazole glycerol phosphate synthase subunit HisH n=1 Tax=Candidatus Harrisonbacteria bacterium CG10_big_fil_rev_8_21_14_0_10_42_17 TaxID=1974584 RepID=A0A2M6WIE0_9BACT|nr:MAG: imidazole glycerol phosphate synthase subunit HisH [Candidatus Harrisonbacteria bacterium CG10_big_fil_rev_8_21_14_0_10_42_17]